VIEFKEYSYRATKSDYDMKNTQRGQSRVTVIRKNTQWDQCLLSKRILKGLSNNDYDPKNIQGVSQEWLQLQIILKGLSKSGYDPR